jgi:hypothetical protein
MLMKVIVVLGLSMLSLFATSGMAEDQGHGAFSIRSFPEEIQISGTDVYVQKKVPYDWICSGWWVFKRCYFITGTQTPSRIYLNDPSEVRTMPEPGDRIFLEQIGGKTLELGQFDTPCDAPNGEYPPRYHCYFRLAVGIEVKDFKSKTVKQTGVFKDDNDRWVLGRSNLYDQESFLITDGNESLIFRQHNDPPY